MGDQEEACLERRVLLIHSAWGNFPLAQDQTASVRDAKADCLAYRRGTDPKFRAPRSSNTCIVGKQNMQNSKQSGKLRTFPDLENPENNQNGQSLEAFYFIEILTLNELKMKKLSIITISAEVLC